VTLPPLWTRNFRLLWAASFMMAVSFYFLLPTLPLYVVQWLHASPTDVGWIIGLFTLTALAVRPFAGLALDRFGRKTVYLPALILFALAMAGYLIPQTLAGLLVLRLIHGIFWGMTTTGGGTLAADIVPPARRGEGLSWYGMTMTLGMALGPVGGLWLLRDHGPTTLFVAATVLGLSGALAAALLRPPVIAPRPPSPFAWSSLIEGRLRWVALLFALYAATYGGVVSFITLYGAELGIVNSGWFFLTYAVAVATIRPVAGRTMDRRGPAGLFTIALVLLMTGFAILALAQGLIGFLVAAAVLGLGSGIVMPTCFTMGINLVEPYRRGAANGTLFSALDLGIGLGAVLLGIVAHHFGLAAMYACSIGVLLPALMLFHLKVLPDYRTRMTPSPPSTDPS